MSEPVTLQSDGDVAWITINNPPVNATSTAVRGGLKQAIADAQGHRIAVLKCAGNTFIAGGDMSEFDRPPMPPHLPDVVDAIENSATPVIAMMHGTVLGGGFEIAMACAHRIAAPGTRFGLPEVNVGLIPGAGGTQRAPRLLGWDMAVEMACLGLTKTAEDLLAIGAIDHISDDPAGAVGTLGETVPDPVSQRPAPSLSDAERDALTQRVTTSAKGRRAPLHNLDALFWAIEPYGEAQPRERARHVKLRQSDESKALRHIFFAEREAAKPAAASGGSVRAIAKVAIIGGGFMGSGIAASCLNAGLTVCVIEQDHSAADRAYQTLSDLMRGALDRNKITQTQFDARMAAFSTAATRDAGRDADLVIEAIHEDLAAKQGTFAALDRIVASETLLATNTSYLDPNAIFAQVRDTTRCLGLHFFSPAHIMKLVEVVEARDTSADVLASAFALAKKLRKVPVLSRVCDGFIGNRILMAYRRAAEYLLADGALPHQVDAAMRDFGMAMGPFEAQDMAGLQIAEANRRRQDEARDPRERYVTISDTLCALGRYGQRSGQGWYGYEAGSRAPIIDDAVEAIITGYSRDQNITRRAFTDDHIRHQLLAAMANEGARIVDEGIAETDAAIDVVKVNGYGFPRHRAGPMHWASQGGREAIGPALAALEAASPHSWKRARRFQTA